MRNEDEGTAPRRGQVVPLQETRRVGPLALGGAMFRACEMRAVCRSVASVPSEEAAVRPDRLDDDTVRVEGVCCRFG